VCVAVRAYVRARVCNLNRMHNTLHVYDLSHWLKLSSHNILLRGSTRTLCYFMDVTSPTLHSCSHAKKDTRRNIPYMPYGTYTQSRTHTDTHTRTHTHTHTHTHAHTHKHTHSLSLTHTYTHTHTHTNTHSHTHTQTHTHTRARAHTHTYTICFPFSRQCNDYSMTGWLFGNDDLHIIQVSSNGNLYASIQRNKCQVGISSPLMISEHNFIVPVNTRLKYN
jgi:hypothetical protein